LLETSNLLLPGYRGRTGLALAGNPLPEAAKKSKKRRKMADGGHKETKAKGV
jgi:hypothetical protein